MGKKRWKIGLFSIAITGLLFCNSCCSKGSELEPELELELKPEVETKKHAYLLDEEDIFFASVPGEWKTYIPESGGVEFFCPDKKTENTDRVEYFSVDVREVFKDAFSYESENFIFADGVIGKRYVARNREMNRGKNEGSYIEGMISGDNRYMIYLFNYGHGLNRGEYDRNKETLENFYCGAAFQTGRIGIGNDSSDKVRLHMRINGRIELDIREGTFFEKTVEKILGDDLVYLKFYLDDTKDNYIIFYPYGCLYFEEDMWEAKERPLIDSDYGACALYWLINVEGKKIGRFSYLDSDWAIEFSVLEENEQLFKEAMEIIKSVKLW